MKKIGLLLITALTLAGCSAFTNRVLTVNVNQDVRTTLTVGDTATAGANLTLRGQPDCSRTWPCAPDTQQNVSMDSRTTWSISDESVAQFIEPDHRWRRQRLEALAPGVARVCARFEGLSYCAVVTVTAR